MHLPARCLVTLTALYLQSSTSFVLLIKMGAFLACRCYSNRRAEATTRWRGPSTPPPCSHCQKEAPISLRCAPSAKGERERSAPKFAWSPPPVSSLVSSPLSRTLHYMTSERRSLCTGCFLFVAILCSPLIESPQLLCEPSFLRLILF